jgi:hypothetical protein
MVKRCSHRRGGGRGRGKVDREVRGEEGGGQKIKGSDCLKGSAEIMGDKGR